MANDFKTRKGLTLFATLVADNSVYAGQSKSQFKTQLAAKGGSKVGETFHLYLVGGGTVTSGISITSADNGDIVQNEVSVTLKNKKTTANLTMLQKLTDIEDFGTEVAIPKTQLLGAEIERDIVESTVFTADGALVATSANYALLSVLASKLTKAKSSGQKVGFVDPDELSDIQTDGLNKFLPPTVTNGLYDSVKVGKFSTVEWMQEVYMPTVTIGAVPTTSATITASYSTNGTHTLAVAGFTAGIVKKGTFFFITGVKAVNTLGQSLTDNKAFIALSDATVTAGAASIEVSPIFFTGGGKNVSVSTLTSGDVIIPSAQVSGTTYRIIQVRDHDALAYDTWELETPAGCESSTASAFGVTIKGTVVGNGTDMSNIYRWDCPYVATIPDSRLCRIAFVKVA